VSVSIAASANPVEAGTPVTFTATPVNGGSEPFYQWKVNANNVNNANNAAFTYIPEDGDVVSCILTSSANCVTGNPATSNLITMTVNSVPVNLNLNNVTVMGTQCFNATQTITVAGNNTTFTVMNGGRATLIAGQNILFYPGTMVEPGGYLWGYIAPGGPYCEPPVKAQVLSGATETPTVPEKSFFRVYPNPTTGEFTLDLDGYVPGEVISMEVFNTKGEKIASAIMTDERRQQFSLSGKPAGLYLVRVITGNRNGMSRIVKIN
jgi:hypothetical protein